MSAGRLPVAGGEMGGRAGRVPVTGGEMAFVEEGQGPAVVLLHGFPASSFLWRNVIPALSDSMRVVAPDLLGYGASSRPPVPGMELTAQARAVRDLLEGIGVDRFAAVGHDLGGGVAQVLGLDHGASCLVLVDSVAFDAWPEEAVGLLRAATPDRVTPSVAGDVVDRALERGTARADRLTAGVRAAYRAPFAGDREGAAALVRAAQAMDGSGLATREPDLAGLDVPVMVVWGEDDPFLPPELGDRLAGILPDAAQVELPGCSHLVPEDAPETLAALCREFLRVRFLGLPHGHEAHGHAGGPVPITLGRRPPGEVAVPGPDR